MGLVLGMLSSRRFGGQEGKRINLLAVLNLIKLTESIAKDMGINSLLSTRPQANDASNFSHIRDHATSSLSPIRIRSSQIEAEASRGHWARKLVRQVANASFARLGGQRWKGMVSR